MDLIKVLGPYGKRFVNSPLRTPNSARPAAVAKPNSARIASVRRAVRLSSGNREKFHKKTNLTFIRDGEGRVADRLIDVEKRQKDRRAQVIMENRMPNSQYPNVSDPRMATRAMTSKASVTVSTTASKDKQGSDARAEQLAKWKREKEELNKQKLAIKKPPFKVMGNTMSTINYPNVSETRMATRAMTSKASTALTSSGSQRFTSVERMDQMTKIRREKEEQKLSKTKLSAKRPPSKTSQPERSESSKVLVTPVKVEQAVVKAATPKAPVILEEPPKAPVTQAKLEQAPAQVTPVTVAESVTQAKVPPKKKKGMQFDSVYMEFNNVFVQTCSSLMKYSQQWTKILADTPDIPEEVIEDIQSTLGQSQLLMESKLPQFGELLYFYLSRHQDPGPVLPCDLEGWWDVASISIEKVKQRFEKLITMSTNNWEVPKPVQIKRSRPALLPQNQKQNDNAEPGKEKPPKASAGLRAFLAGKRKNKVDPDVEVQPPMEPVIEQSKPQPTVSKIEAAVEFEEGFRSIQTPPIRTPSNASSASLFRVTGSHALHSDPRVTRRQSSSNTSLRMLAVRSSMGSICKIGIEAGSYSPKISPVALKFRDSDSDI